MRYLAFILLLVSLHAQSQSCDRYASLTQDQQGEKLYAFNETIDIYDGPKKFSVYGFIWETSLTLAIDVVTEHNCMGDSHRIVFELRDGSKATFQNQLTNCNRQIVIHLNKPDLQFDALRTKEIKSIRVYLEKNNLTASSDLKKDVAHALRMSIDCLSSFIRDTPERDSTYSLLAAPDTAGIYTVVEFQPKFFGGTQALNIYLKENISFPKHIAGKVSVSFVVNTEGEIENAEMTPPNTASVDEVVLRAIRNMPRWKPGLQNGKPVKVKYNLTLNVN